MNRKKMGFSAPLAEWLCGELKNIAEYHLFTDNRGVKNFFEIDGLRRIWESHQGKRRNYGNLIWAFLMFELWYKKFMP